MKAPKSYRVPQMALGMLIPSGCLQPAGLLFYIKVCGEAPASPALAAYPPPPQILPLRVAKQDSTWDKKIFPCSLVTAPTSPSVREGLPFVILPNFL